MNHMVVLSEMVCGVCKMAGHNKNSKKCPLKVSNIDGGVAMDVPVAVAAAVPNDVALNGSQIAKSGFKAETMMTTQSNIIPALEQYFGKQIKPNGITKVEGRSKSDNKIEFTDDTHSMFQLKNTAMKANGTANVKSRGFSIDRRDVDKIDPESPELTETLMSVCLRDTTKERKTVSKDVSEKIVKRNILGSEPTTEPDYFIKTESDRNTGEILRLSIATKDVFVGKLVSLLHDTVISKKTCVHLSPNIYLQRKGGTKGEKKPNQIQTKMVLTQDIDALFTNVALTC